MPLQRKITKLEHVTLVIPVLDLAHLEMTIANLADLRPYLRADCLDVELRLSDRFTENAQEQQKQMDALTQAIQQSDADLKGSIPKENK